MKLTHKTAGLGMIVLALGALGSVAIAQDMNQPQGGMDMMKMGGAMMMPPELNFDAVDANKDGKITPDEVAAWRKAQSDGVDANKDGKLSVDEIAAMHLKAMTDAAHKMAERMVARLDTDGDHMLSAAELLAPPMPPNLFDRIDTNKDGVIDKAEADAARKMMASHMHHGQGDHGGHGDHGNRDQMPGDQGANPDGTGPDGTGPDGTGSDDNGN